MLNSCRTIFDRNGPRETGAVRCLRRMGGYIYQKFYLITKVYLLLGGDSEVAAMKVLCGIASGQDAAAQKWYSSAPACASTSYTRTFPLGTVIASAARLCGFLHFFALVCLASKASSRPLTRGTRLPLMQGSPPLSHEGLRGNEQVPPRVSPGTRIHWLPLWLRAQASYSSPGAYEPPQASAVIYI